MASLPHPDSNSNWKRAKEAIYWGWEKSLSRYREPLAHLFATQWFDIYLLTTGWLDILTVLNDRLWNYDAITLLLETLYVLVGYPILSVSAINRYRGLKFSDRIFKRWILFLSTELLLFIVTCIGLLFFILPGLVFISRLWYSPVLSTVELISPVHALKQAWRLTRSNCIETSLPVYCKFILIAGLAFLQMIVPKGPILLLFLLTGTTSWLESIVQPIYGYLSYKNDFQLWQNEA
ncbi:MAG: hypothetical protein WCK64_07265 [Synechococcaceae cyanobacterium ELA445]